MGSIFSSSYESRKRDTCIKSCNDTYISDKKRSVEQFKSNNTEGEIGGRKRKTMKRKRKKY